MGSAAPVMPDWPARLSEDMASAYLDVSKTTFRTRWQRRLYPQPLREGKRLFWSRVQLDRFVASQFGLTEAVASDDTWSDLRG